MIYPFAADDLTRLAIAYNGLTINSPVDPTTTALIEVNIASVDNQWDAVTEPKVTTHGMEGYEPRKVSTLIRLDGMIRAGDPMPKANRLPILIDAARALNAAFDADNAYAVDSATAVNRGYLPLTFSIPTADVTNYPTGLITAKFFVRSIKRPVQRTSHFEGDSCRFTLFLQAIDPRCYYTVGQSASRSNVGNITVDNTLASHPSWGTLTFTFTGAGSGIVSMSRTGMTGLIKVDMTGRVLNDVVVVDLERRTVTVNGVLTMSDLTQYDEWPEVRVASDTWAIANVSGTLAATVALTWSRAFS